MKPYFLSFQCRRFCAALGDFKRSGLTTWDFAPSMGCRPRAVFDDKAVFQQFKPTALKPTFTIAFQSAAGRLK